MAQENAVLALSSVIITISNDCYGQQQQPTGRLIVQAGGLVLRVGGVTDFLSIKYYLCDMFSVHGAALSALMLLVG